MTRKAKRKARASAIRSIYKSGLELVPKRRCKGKSASTRDYAKVNFKPWSKPSDGELFPSPEMMLEAGMSARIAHALTCKSKAELIDMHGRLTHETMDATMAALTESAEHLKAIAQMIDVAGTRLLVAASARYVAGQPFKHSA